MTWEKERNAMSNDLKKVNEILNSPGYREHVRKIEQCEKERSFCRHNMEHFIDVARIAWIICMEEGLSYSRETIYAIALLHDIGRWMQYQQGTPHEEASVMLSEELLQEAGFDAEERKIITSAILNHRRECEDELSRIIYRSDKLSRKCFICEAEAQCNWEKDKKNLRLVY